MLIILPFFNLAQIPPLPPVTPQEVVQPQPVRRLPGKLNNIPVFNSNSPELVLNEGILLSTFPSFATAHPQAHLDFALQGEFDIFAHHVAKAPTPDNLRTLYLGIIVYNPGKNPVTLKILAGASYLSQPDAPFIDLPSQVEDPDGKVYAGPGNRVMGDILRNKFQEIFPPQITIAPEDGQMLLNVPIPVKELDPPLNGRSTYIRLFSDGPVYVASLAMFAPLDDMGNERPPTLEEWAKLLIEGDLVTPRDRIPSPPNTIGTMVYGRVAGVSRGSQWQADLVDNNYSANLTIPARGEAFSYGISTLEGGTLGTGQSQSATLLVRYPDTAYKAHGNYGVEYSLTLPLYNPTTEVQTVTVALETPLKQDQLQGGLRFLEPPGTSVFFRGTVQVTYEDNNGLQQSHYYHLAQRQGQQGEPLVKLNIQPKQRRIVKVNFLYPPDATPPQVLTIRTFL